MGENTKIEWADDSANFWWGCHRHGPGCLNCYAESFANRFGKKIWGRSAPRMWMPNTINHLRRLNAKAEKAGMPRIVFVNSMSDFFEDHAGPIIDHQKRTVHTVSPVDAPAFFSVDVKYSKYAATSLSELRDAGFAAIDEFRWLRFLLLTKRPENVGWMWHTPSAEVMAENVKWNRHGSRRENCWLGTSIACQADADRNIPALLKCRDLAPVLFLSIEPLVGPVDLFRSRCEIIEFDCSCERRTIAFVGDVYSERSVDLDDPNDPGWNTCCGSCGIEKIRPKIDWVIIGGESGPNARPCNLAWIRSIVEQCKAAGVPCFVKQLGSSPQFSEADIWAGSTDVRRRDKKGGDPAEWPEDLQIRQFPEVAHA